MSNLVSFAIICESVANNIEKNELVIFWPQIQN
jgi:hypothetical protein